MSQALLSYDAAVTTNYKYNMSVYVSQQSRYGTLMFNRNDDTIGRSLTHYGEWSEPETFLFAQMLRPGDTVIEAGANMGSHTVMLSGAVGDSGQVYAFEPQRHTFQLLCSNLVINQRTNVYAHQWALGDRDGEIDFPVNDPYQAENFGAVSLHAQNSNRQHEAVPIRRLDALKLPALHFLKADVEGCEVEVLRGAMQTIEKHRPILHLEYLNHYTGNAAASYFEMLSALDYRMWFYISPLFNMQNFLGNSENIFAGLWSFDLVCIPRERGEMEGLVEMLTAQDTSSCTDLEAWRSVRYIAS